MGRPQRYRERIQFEMHSVQAKSIQSFLSEALQKDLGKSRRVRGSGPAQPWLVTYPGSCAVSGQVCLSVPATPSRRYARQKRLLATITAVDVGEDTEVWRTYGPSLSASGTLRKPELGNTPVATQAPVLSLFKPVRISSLKISPISSGVNFPDLWYHW